MHAAYHRGLATSAASSVRGSVPATLPQLLRSDCLHAPAAPRPAPRRSPARPLQPRAQPPQPKTRSIIHAQPAFASTRSQRSWLPMRAAYHRGSATSAASSLRDSVPATLPQLLRCKCLHATAAPRPAPCRTPTPRYSPAHNRPSPHAASSMHGRRSQAPAHSAAARRCTQRTTEA
jgi:hypothetical protein